MGCMLHRWELQEPLFNVFLVAHSLRIPYIFAFSIKPLHFNPDTNADVFKQWLWPYITVAPDRPRQMHTKDKIKSKIIASVT